jgi:hypothetical protein
MPRVEYRFVETRWGREKKNGHRKPMLYFRPCKNEPRGEQLPGPKGSPEFVAEYNRRLAAYLANPKAPRERESAKSKRSLYDRLGVRPLQEKLGLAAWNPRRVDPRPTRLNRP